MIKAIFFDLGGVLINLDRSACIRHFKDDLGFERINDFIDNCHHKGYVMDFEEGLLSEKEFYDMTRQYCRPAVQDKEIAEAFATLTPSIDHDKIVLLNELKGKYSLFLLSNINPISKRVCRELFLNDGIEWNDTFADIFMSFEMKMIKPGKAIFNESVRRSGFQADEILFIDDSQANVDAAISCGLNAVYYERGTSLRATISPILGL